MHIDRDLFMEQGFLIIENIVSRDQLVQLRFHCETALQAQQLIWAKEAGPDAPPGGYWEEADHPTMSIDRVVDRQTAPAIEFCLNETLLSVCQELMQAEPVPRVMQMMCSPTVDHGYTDWHRDFDSEKVAPLEGLAMDTQANGPGELQWNITLYDDDVLWVVPGSHLRADTDEEKRQILQDPRVPLPGARQVKLKAGAGVVYTNIILHWGSIYKARLRRIVHYVYRSFGGQLFPHYQFPAFQPDFFDKLAPSAAAAFEKYWRLFTEERDDIERLMRAILARDEPIFREVLAKLHPGRDGRMVALILLSKWVRHITTLSGVDARRLSVTEWADAAGVDRIEARTYAEVAHRFTAQEGQELGRRFKGLEEQLTTDREASWARLRERFKDLEPKPADFSSFEFRTRSTRHLYSEMPVNFGLDEFVASWNR